MKKKSKTPPRTKCKESYPTVSFRVSKELYDRLQAVKKAEGKSITDVLKVGVGLLEVEVRKGKEIRVQAYDEGWEKGIAEAEELHSVSYPCSVCGEAIVVTTEAEKKAIRDICVSVGGVTLIVLTGDNHSGHCTQ